jgi:hypothetical protein
MRENRPSGSEGGPILIQSSLPLSIIQSLRAKALLAFGPISLFTFHRSGFAVYTWPRLGSRISFIRNVCNIGS